MYNNGRRFAFERDIVNLFPEVCSRSAVSLARDRMPAAVRAFADHCGTTEEDVYRACEAMARFINESRSQKYAGNDLASAWVDSGLAAVPQPALLALFSVIGMTTTNAYFVHLRNAIPVGVAKPGGDSMSEMFDQAAHAMRTDNPATARRRASDLEARGRQLKDESS